MHGRHDVAPRYIVLHLDRLAGADLPPADRPVAAPDRGRPAGAGRRAAVGARRGADAGAQSDDGLEVLQHARNRRPAAAQPGHRHAGGVASRPRAARRRTRKTAAPNAGARCAGSPPARTRSRRGAGTFQENPGGRLMNASVVNMAAVSKSFGSQPVLDGVDWSIAAGKVVGLLGRNGAGKSTLLECALGLREVNAGGVTLFDDPATRLTDATRARIGYVPQKPDLFEWLTPLQLLAYFKAQYPRWNAAKVEGLLSRWGFDAAMRHKPIGIMSVGEQQRLSIIRALAHDPRLLVLAEPVASLDPVGRRDFLHELVDGVIERATTVIFATHILSDLERVALDVAFLQGGKITLEAPLDELLESAHRITGTAAALARLQFRDEIRRQQDRSGGVSILARLSGQEAADLRAGPDLRVETLSLEDLFVEVTK